ncbi:MAG TPA: division/cell wall cluster transcriptional repressor MraZ [bacterium]|nr:division/cell wall cluster transcriptional repressor MraZ [bacterium]
MAETKALLVFGNYPRKLDSKNRLVLPAPMRRALPQTGCDMVLTRGLDPCLQLFTRDYWPGYLEKNLDGMTDLSDERRQLMRYFSAQAEMFTLDKVGRVLLPQLLKDDVGIQQEVMVVGVVDHIELWNPEAWQRCVQAMQQRIGAAAKKN